MDKENDQNNFYIADLGVRCNNACLMCVVGANRLANPIDKNEVIKDIKNKRNEGKTRIEFTGGEPLVRSDIIELIKTAKDLGYREINISTNGRMMKDEAFCKNLIDNGLSGATISIHGSNSEIHDLITGVRGAFSETIQGFNNFRKHSGNTPTIATAVMRPNHRDLTNIAKLLVELKVEIWSIADLTPNHRGRDNYRNLSVRRSELKKDVVEAISASKEINLLEFFNFSRCLLPELTKRMIYFDIGAKMDQWDLPDIGDWRYEREGSGSFKDALKVRTKFCVDCVHAKTCGGIWRDYLEIYGTNPEDF